MAVEYSNLTIVCQLDAARDMLYPCCFQRTHANLAPLLQPCSGFGGMAEGVPARNRFPTLCPSRQVYLARRPGDILSSSEPAWYHKSPNCNAWPGISCSGCGKHGACALCTRHIVHPSTHVLPVPSACLLIASTCMLWCLSTGRCGGRRQARWYAGGHG